MSARRDARAAAAADLDDLDDGPPRALLRSTDPVWRNRGRYVAFLNRHGLEAGIPARERMAVDASPRHRRNCASAAWGRLNGITTTTASGRPGHADWTLLRQMGLIA